MFQDPDLPGLRPDPELCAALEDALRAKGSRYVPRTHHRDEHGGPRFVNRLIEETSPYLLQHAHNPVSWYPWSDAAFERARAENKPVVLSVGYSTCHWCHVMERESFEDLEVAEWMNRRFVAIKVDREERPDVDEVYMQAVQALTGRGGWPMTVVMDGEKRPFFAGTYFPARDGDRPGSRGFLSILRFLAHEHAHNPERLDRSAEEIAAALEEAARLELGGEVPSLEPARAAAGWYRQRHDRQWGGFGGAPKFPRPVDLGFLHQWGRATGDSSWHAVALHTLDAMVAGGLRDHVGGGFHRYSVDERWEIPHFEKMLYDNAQLVSALLDAHQVRGRGDEAAVARETLDYLAEEMQAPSGAFYSATDADSLDPATGHTEEGLFFTWTEAELEALLSSPEASAVKAYYGTSALGNFEGRNHFFVARPATEVARTLGLAPADLDDQLRRARARLREARARRPAPARDEKILASWNGLTLSAFARAGWVLGDPSAIRVAVHLADFLLGAMRDPKGRMLHTHPSGSGLGFLDDQAFVLAGLVDLFTATGELRYLDAALALEQAADAAHRDPEGGVYFTSARDAPGLLTRQAPSYDGAEPSGNSVMADALLALARITGREDLRAKSSAIVAGQRATLEGGPVAVPKLLCALLGTHARLLEVFVVVPDRVDPRDPLVEVVRGTYLPHAVVLAVPEAEVERLAARVPSLGGKTCQKGRSTAYVCEEGACQQPTDDPEQLREQLRAALGRVWRVS